MSGTMTGICCGRRPPLALIVDPHLDTREMLAHVLRLNRFNVVAASGGCEALEIAGSLLPDVVVIEIMLPDLDGFEIAARLKANPATAAIRVVAVTSYSRPDLMLRSSRAGFDDVLRKPAAPGDIVAAVCAILASVPIVGRWHPDAA